MGKGRQQALVLLAACGDDGGHHGRYHQRRAAHRRAPHRYFGNVTHAPAVIGESEALFAEFKDGSIDGAWVPESWATRLVLEGGGKVLVDEADLWPTARS